jgi:fumarate reductase subunit C
VSAISIQTRNQALFWYAQRISAMVLAVCVIVHLVTIIYAVRGGLTGAEILGRTRGNWGFGAFYALFVIACAVHAPIGVLNATNELRAWRGSIARFIAMLLALLILMLGLRAVFAVVVAT